MGFAAAGGGAGSDPKDDSGTAIPPILALTASPYFTADFSAFSKASSAVL